jgi:hypothetical protein
MGVVVVVEVGALLVALLDGGALDEGVVGETDAPFEHPATRSTAPSMVRPPSNRARMQPG